MNNSKINISKRLNECLSTQIFDLLIKCGEFTERNSASLFLVCGCLIDILLNKRPKDIDLTLVNGDSNLVQNLSEYLGGKIIFKSQAIITFLTSLLWLIGALSKKKAKHKERKNYHSCSLCWRV